MKELVTEILAPLVAALNNIANAIREGAPDPIPAKAVEEVAPTTAPRSVKAVKHKEPNIGSALPSPPPTPAPVPKAPAAPTVTPEEVVKLAQEALAADRDNNGPKMKAYNAANGITKVSACPPEKLADLKTFLEGLISGDADDDVV